MAFSWVSWPLLRARRTGSPFKKLEQRPTAFQFWLSQFKSILDALRLRWHRHRGRHRTGGPQAKDPHQTLLDVIGRLLGGRVPPALREHEGPGYSLAAIWQIFIPCETEAACERAAQRGLQTSDHARLHRLGDAPVVRPVLERVGQSTHGSRDPARAAVRDRSAECSSPTTFPCIQLAARVPPARLRHDPRARRFPGRAVAELAALLSRGHVLEFSDTTTPASVCSTVRSCWATSRRRTRPPSRISSRCRQMLVAARAGIAAAATPAAPAQAAMSCCIFYPDRYRRLAQRCSLKSPGPLIGELFGTRYLSEQLRALEGSR